MAACGCFLTACGFAYHGPKGIIRFAPKIGPEDFKAAFTAAEGWGSYSQRSSGRSFHAELVLKWGRLSLREIEVPVSGPAQIALQGRPLAHSQDGSRLRLKTPIVLKPGQALRITS